MKFSSNVRTLGLFGFGAAILAACGTAPPPRELVDARSAYLKAASGPARDVDPGALNEARKSLNHAENAYAASAETSDVRSLGYVAERKSELAEIQAQDALNATQQRRSEAEIAQLTALQLSTTNQRLQQEQAQRADAERRAREALSHPGGPTVREDARGLVITLPGEVLFQTGKSALRPNSRQRLNEVADVLKDQPTRSIIVEGHTDSTGTDAKNDVLSLQRAEHVKDYLVSRGVASDRVVARGLGSSHPVASNETSEGRAENRRVEIIIETARPSSQ
jgi:outer membrane protein OmpA-like peptidoglycan-associated protein